MKRDLDDLIAKDLQRKLVFLTGLPQVGKTTLSQQLLAATQPSQHLNYDVAPDRAKIEAQSGRCTNGLLVLDALHKMKARKP
jgi:predicted AAA+ superfamily ATPase